MSRNGQIIAQGELRLIALKAQSALQNLVPRDSQAIFTATGGLQVALRGNADLPYWMEATANLYRCFVTFIYYICIVVAIAKAVSGASEKCLYINRVSHRSY